MSDQHKTTICATCRWWDRLQEGHTYGDCRRMPPLNTFYAAGRQTSADRVEVNLMTDRRASWPNTSQDDWCGEHRQRIAT